MRLFLDTANLEEIRKASELGVIDGVTTNPSLIAKEGKRFDDVVNQICAMIDGPISAEAVSENSTGMIEEAKTIAKMHKNVVVKIPMTGEGLKAVKACKELGIKTNVTLIFSANQALLAAKAGATYVSPFVGRIDDTTEYGMELVERIVSIYRNYNYATEVIVASVRNPLHVLEAAQMGADIATVPYSVLQQMIRHPLTDLGIQRFLEDWKKVPGR